MNYASGMSSLKTLTAALALLAAWQSNAVADNGPVSSDTRTQVVRYDDLNLQADAGVRALYARLAEAAVRACGDFDRRSAADRRDWRQCYDTALGAAVERADISALLTLHESGRSEETFPDRIAAVR